MVIWWSQQGRAEWCPQPLRRTEKCMYKPKEAIIFITSIQAVFFVSGHVGVIYDTDNQTQQLLLGHSNTISSICVSEDRKFIATADEGPHDSLIIVWNAMSATPIATIFNPSNTGLLETQTFSYIYVLHNFVFLGSYMLFVYALFLGIKAMDMTPDASHLATLSNGPSQTLSIWNWVADQTRPVTLGIVPSMLT